MNDKSLFEARIDRPTPTSFLESSGQLRQRLMGRLLMRPVSIVAAIVGIMVTVGCLSGGAASSNTTNTTQLGVDLEDMRTLLHTDPRYATSEVVFDLGNDASGGIVETVTVIMPDSMCPAQNATDCASVINDAARIMLTAPSIDNHPGIEVTLVSFRPVRCATNVTTNCRSKPGKPPLASHTVDEWRALLEESGTSTP